MMKCDPHVPVMSGSNNDRLHENDPFRIRIESSMNRIFRISLDAFFLLVIPVLTTSAALPSIESQPQSQTVILYHQAVFDVIASGTEPFSYQWFKDGSPIAGATKNQMVPAQPHFSEAGK